MSLRINNQHRRYLIKIKIFIESYFYWKIIRVDFRLLIFSKRNSINIYLFISSLLFIYRHFFVSRFTIVQHFRLNSYSQFIPVCYCRKLSSSLSKQELKYIRIILDLKYYYSPILNQLISIKIFDNTNLYKKKIKLIKIKTEKLRINFTQIPKDDYSHWSNKAVYTGKATTSKEIEGNCFFFRLSLSFHPISVQRAVRNRGLGQTRSKLIPVQTRPD